MNPAALAFFLTLVVAGSARAETAELTAEVTEHLREIHERNPDLRDDAFSKMGGSSAASRAFLHCFATPYVELGEHGDLAETVEYFAAGRRNSFNRESEAAGVSWNLRYVLGGRPANFRKELERTQARWALILFGGNDAQNENERVYFKRLVYLVEELAEMGVVPILGAALPRRNNYKDRWISRFNAITEAVAEHWSLPYIDYHAGLSTLRRKGLARDGVHPNVLGQGGLKAACQLTEKGLRYGNNLRNLLTLEMLDAVTKAVGHRGRDRDSGSGGDSYSGRDRDSASYSDRDSGSGRDSYRDSGRDSASYSDRDSGADTYADADTDTDADADADTDVGTDTGTDTDTEAGTDAGTDTVPARVSGPARVPFSVLVSKPDLAAAEDLPKNCGSLKPGSRLYRHRLELAERARLRASAFDLAGYKHRILWVRIDENGERCVRRRTQTLEVDAKPGMWDLIVEVPERAAQDGQMLILVTGNPRLR